MDLQEIRDQLMSELETDINHWSEVINNTSPGNYRLEDWDIDVPPKDFYVDIPKKRFTFKNVDFSAQLLLGSSNDGIVKEYNKPASGVGTFEFTSKNKVRITNIDVDIDSDIYG